MEGTVTISLKDYEEFIKEVKEKRDYYFNLAFKQVELLEKVEEFLKVEEIETELVDEISEALEDWYG